jgi:hypothetical protein
MVDLGVSTKWSNVFWMCHNYNFKNIIMFSFDPSPQNFMKIWCGLWMFIYVLKLFLFTFS